MSKHTPKYYTSGDVTCDMRSGRKIFFPVMYDDEQVADIWIDNVFGHRNELILSVIIKLTEYIKNNLIDNIMNIVSQITRDNKFRSFRIEELSSKSNKFPKYRRQRLRDDHAAAFYLSRKNCSRHNGSFLNPILFGNYIGVDIHGLKIITRDTYKKILKLRNNDSPHRGFLPNIIFDEDMTLNLFVVSYMYFDDVDELKDIALTIFSRPEERKSPYFNIIVYFNQYNFDKNKRFIFPKIISEDSNQGIIFVFYCYDEDLKSYTHYDEIDNIDMGNYNRDHYDISFNHKEHRIKMLNKNYVHYDDNDDD